ncbi:DNA-binding protein [Pseudomonas putida]|uniref:DNA-binding protein n=1 Tax=Pseudomonas guariconensis TaxID=1288410 RepID=UPI0024BD244C|nr:DNA-binding protein [Pseudomonas putida]
MARGGINLAVVKKAREALLARGQNPSIDAVRVELGNTGSKTTIQRYLKEIDGYDSRPTASPARLSDELTTILESLLTRLIAEGNEALAHERTLFGQERQKLEEGARALEGKLEQADQTIARLELALKSQVEELQTSQSSLQAEVTRNARISQSCTDLEVRVQEKDEQIRSLEEKHRHARDALEHYRAATKEQREQDERRHDAQLHQQQQEVTALQQTLMVKQDEIARLIRDNERLIGDNRQSSREVARQRDSIERLRADVGLANAATARAEGARELLQEQMITINSASDALRTTIASLEIREKQSSTALEQALAEVEALRASNSGMESPQKE